MKPTSLAFALVVFAVVATWAVACQTEGTDRQIEEAMLFAAGTSVQEWSALHAPAVRRDWLEEGLLPAGERALLVKRTCEDEARTEILTVRAPGAKPSVPATVAYLKLSERETFSIRRASTNSATPILLDSNVALPEWLHAQCQPSGPASAVSVFRDAAATLSQQSTVLQPFVAEWAGHLVRFEPIPNPKFSRGWKASIEFPRGDALQGGFEGITGYLTQSNLHPMQKSEWLSSLSVDQPPLARYWTYLLGDDMVARIAMVKYSFGPQSAGEGKVEILLTSP